MKKQNYILFPKFLELVKDKYGKTGNKNVKYLFSQVNKINTSSKYFEDFWNGAKIFALENGHPEWNDNDANIRNSFYRGDASAKKAAALHYYILCTPKYSEYGTRINNKIFGKGNFEKLFKNPFPTVGASRLQTEPHIDPLFLSRKSKFESEINSNLVEYVTHQDESGFDAFMLKQDSGFWLLTAGPGSGKTTLMSSLALKYSQKQKCLSFFFHKNYAIGSISFDRGDFYQYVFAWLKYTYDAEDWFENNPNPKNGEQLRILLYSLSSIGEITEQNPLIILIDGLDEILNSNIYTDGGKNPLKLKAELPDGVFIGYSYRTKSDDKLSSIQKNDLPRHQARLELEKSEAHKNTVRAYVKSMCLKNTFILPYYAPQKRPNGISDSVEYIEFLCQKANFNFMILKCVLNEKAYWDAGGTGIDLTNDLKLYYEQQLARMHESREAGNAPLAVLCFAHRDKISGFAFQKMLVRNYEKKSHFDGYLKEWAEQGLIIKTIENQEHWYSLYHETYRDFIASKKDHVDSATVGEDIINNIIGHGGIIETIRKLDSMSPAIKLEWLEILLTFSIKWKKYNKIHELLSQKETWLMASSFDGGLSKLLNRLDYIDPRATDGNPNESRFDEVKSIFEEISLLLKEWTDGKELGDCTYVSIKKSGAMNLTQPTPSYILNFSRFL